MTRHEKSPSPAIFGIAWFPAIDLREIPVRATQDAVEKPVNWNSKEPYVCDKPSFELLYAHCAVHAQVSE